MAKKYVSRVSRVDLMHEGMRKITNRRRDGIDNEFARDLLVSLLHHIPVKHLKREIETHLKSPYYTGTANHKF